MKKILWIVLIAIVGLGGYSMTKYNDLMRAEEDINSVWGNVESAYQRRADLIPNLVNAVKGQANFEKETLTAVMDARSKATAVTINPNTATEDEMAKFQAAQQDVNSSLSRLLVTVEKYPELKAHEGFLNLQAQLEGTENRINTERNNFNAAVKEYNKQVREMPTKIAAMIMGFKAKPQFKAEAGAEKAPVVNFN
ncbi:LemA family protein [Haemophilus parahaemolyticus]|uniref:LemA family protein n=2 Tax=Haemophilus parahaemolyticus TaxID=735 RepID=A0AAE6JSE2_HAEPH|nr:LemA family protein [Haemophilus parahaemolyticus]EIJ72988.1 LemA family protein [Haemophilus parahaemolyticus HK385]OOR97388.1 LemA family protein [Haemophilus parahaemolyticus]QEN11560.1 LemA family protein [Haemophilus parahaemolyticus]QRP12762.1 LemA family protein [Haemophilus parahaemolyticus]STO66420.1 LemA family [Haemophilus parahaemolyticus HK385]